MSYKTAQQLMLDVQKDVGLVSGTAVQTYTEPLIYQAIQTVFDLMYRKRFWDHLTGWGIYTVNGVDGLLTGDIDTVCKGFEDIESIYTSDFRRQIVKPVNVEHKLATGSNALYYTPLKFTDLPVDSFIKKVIRFWPLTATTDVAIRSRIKPDDFAPADIVPFPSDILAMGAAWKLLESDGINPSAASAAQQLYELLYADYVSGLAEDVIGHGGSYGYAPLSIRPL